MTKSFKLAGLVCLALAVPTKADIRAEYTEKDGRGSMTIEVADNGDTRISLPFGGHMLFTAAGDYDVEAGPGGPVTKTFEARRYEFRQVNDESADRGGGPTGELHLVSAEAVMLGNWNGQAFRVNNAYGQQPNSPALVIADDPKLAPLGKAYRHMLRLTKGNVGAVDGLMSEMAVRLESGGLLALGDLALSSISFDPLPPARFALPSKPITLADVQASWAAVPVPVPYDYRAPRRIAALYHQGAVLTLDDDGGVTSWSEGSETGTHYDAPKDARSFCDLGGELFIVTAKGGKPGKREVNLWSGGPSAWNSESWFRETADDPFLTLDCGGKEPVLLTAKTLRLPRSGVVRSTGGERLYSNFDFTTLQAGGYLYVGVELGEFGGSLRRIALSDGSTEMIDDDDDITGLAPDPRRPGCILASVGVEHMLSHGKVLRICGQSIERAYYKPYTVNLDWETDPSQSDRDGYHSVAFYSMVSRSDGVWVAGEDGLYRFGSTPRPEFTPFGPLKRFAASGIDWSNPDFILVSTYLRSDHFVRGYGLVMLPKPK